MKKIDADVIGKPFAKSNAVDNQELIEINEKIRQHPIEKVGKELRQYMKGMKKIK